MATFIGESICKLDGKLRIRIPVNVMNQLHPDANGRFVVMRGFENCLFLYPFNEWEKIDKRLACLDMFIKDNRTLVRALKRGASVVTLDNFYRILLPKHLLKWASIEKELIIAPQTNYYELWNPNHYHEAIDIDSDKLSALAEKANVSIPESIEENKE